MPQKFSMIQNAIVFGLALALPTLALAAPPDRDQQRCLDAHRTALRKVLRAQSRTTIACVRDYSRGKLGSETADSCIFADRKGLVDKAKDKARDRVAKYCTGPAADFGPSDIEQGMDLMIQSDQDLGHRLLGAVFESTLLPGGHPASCQQKVLKRAQACMDERVKALRTCAKAELKAGTLDSAADLQDQCLGIAPGPQPDPGGKIAKDCDTKVEREISRCVTRQVSLLSALPPCSTTDAATAKACASNQSACLTCLALNIVEGTDRDCDLFDDGVDNQSCRGICGNGFLEAGEECEDGNTDPGDGCRADCTIEVCGDGIVDVGEDCDDPGNSCCSASCTFDAVPCSDGNNCTTNDACQAGGCVGELIHPWINEIDYDNNSGGITDREEFVEIAGPAGLDLGGYTLYGVEGADGNCQTPGPGLLSGPVLPGYMHWSVTISLGTVLDDDTGTGIGFLVVCNTPSSTTVINDGNCDVIFPGISPESTFKNGQLLNDPWVCPDGMLLLDPAGDFVDAVSYEGIVGNAGPLGGYFHIDPPYNAGADEGWKPKTSLDKWTNALGKAMSASEWRDSGGCTDQCVFGGLNYGCDWFTGLDPCLGFEATPGALNSGGQRYFCSDLVCGDGVVTGDEQCDEGLGNSDDPDATCRTDCTLRRCGDGIIDPTAAPGYPESCEVDADCGAGETCAGCQCATGTPLGNLDYTVVPGPSDLTPIDDGESTWLRINQPLPALLPVTTGSSGQWSEGPLQFAAGIPDVNGVAPFNLAAEVLVSSTLPALAGGGRVCVKVRPDYDEMGYIDCDGGSNVDALVSINSNFAASAGPMTRTVGANPGDSGAGAAVAYVVIQAGTTGDDATPCENAVYSDVIRTAITTGVARSEIINGLVVGNVAVQLAGQPFNCSSWTPDQGASMAWPTIDLDVPIPVLGIQDVSQVLRLNDD